jgi:uncharacterized membrane protein
LAEGLVTLVVGYDDVEVASADFGDLGSARRAGRVGEYEAAVVLRGDAGYELITTTVDPRMRGTVLGAGLGVVVGVVISPVLAVAAIGAGLGAVFGNLGDQVKAFKHANLAEVERLVDDSTADLIVIASDAVVDEIQAVAMSRHRRIVVPFSEPDVELLRLELQRLMSFGG